jgi:hypothetical protein
MGNSPSSGSPNTEHLSEEELIKLLPAPRKKGEKRDAKNLSVQERLALDELWKRHREEVEKNLRAKIFACGSTLCPSQEPNKEHFLQMCINEAYQAFLRRVSEREYENFGGFLFTLVLNVALDVRDEVIGKGPPDTISADDNTDLLVDEGKKAPQIVANHELRKIMKKLIKKHAGESPLSLNVVVHRSMGDWDWKEIAEKRVPKEILGKSLRTRIRVAQAFYKRDRMRMLQLLSEYKITNPDLFEI